MVRHNRGTLPGFQLWKFSLVSPQRSLLQFVLELAGVRRCSECPQDLNLVDIE